MADKMECDYTDCDVVRDPHTMFQATITTPADREPSTPYVVHACTMPHLQFAISDRLDGFENAGGNNGS